jgi:hypothetical protein
MSAKFTVRGPCVRTLMARYVGWDGLGTFSGHKKETKGNLEGTYLIHLTSLSHIFLCTGSSSPSPSPSRSRPTSVNLVVCHLLCPLVRCGSCKVFVTVPCRVEPRLPAGVKPSTFVSETIDCKSASHRVLGRHNQHTCSVVTTPLNPDGSV